MARLPVAVGFLDPESETCGVSARAQQGRARLGGPGGHWASHEAGPGRPLRATAKAEAGAASSAVAALPPDESPR